MTSTTVKGANMKALKFYFENTKGTGVLATADSDGKVDAAIYSRPHFWKRTNWPLSCGTG